MAIFLVNWAQHLYKVIELRYNTNNCMLVTNIIASFALYQAEPLRIGLEQPAGDQSVWLFTSVAMPSMASPPFPIEVEPMTSESNARVPSSPLSTVVQSLMVLADPNAYIPCWVLS